MSGHRVYCQLDQLLQLEHAGSRLDLSFNPRRLAQHTGQHLSRRRGRGMEFAEYRQYQQGDDPRSIDWRVTARRSKPFTKVFHEETEQPVLLLVDQSMSMFFGSQIAFKSVRAAELAALLTWATLARSDRIGAIVFSDDQQALFKPKRSTRHALHLLGEISHYNQRLHPQQPSATHSRFNQALLELQRIAKPGSQCIIISDWQQFNTDSLNLLFNLQRHCQLTALQIYDPLEQQLPRAPLQIGDGKTHLQLPTDRQFSQHFQQHSQQQQTALQQQLTKLGIGHLPINSHQDPQQQLAQVLLPSRGRR